MYEKSVFSCPVIYAVRKGLAGRKIPGKFLQKSPGTVGGAGCNADTVLWLYLVYGKRLSLGRYRDFYCKCINCFSGVGFFYEMNKICFQTATCN